VIFRKRNTITSTLLLQIKDVLVEKQEVLSKYRLLALLERNTFKVSLSFNGLTAIAAILILIQLNQFCIIFKVKDPKQKKQVIPTMEQPAKCH